MKKQKFKYRFISNARLSLLLFACILAPFKVFASNTFTDYTVQRLGSILYRVSEAQKWVQVEAPYGVRVQILNEQEPYYLMLTAEMDRNPNRSDLRELHRLYPDYEFKTFSQNAQIEHCEITLISKRILPCEIPPAAGTYFSITAPITVEEKKELATQLKRGVPPQIELKVNSSIPVLLQSARYTISLDRFMKDLEAQGIKTGNSVPIIKFMGLAFAHVQNNALTASLEKQGELLEKLLHASSTINEANQKSGANINEKALGWAKLLSQTISITPAQSSTITAVHEQTQWEKRFYSPVIELNTAPGVTP